MDYIKTNKAAWEEAFNNRRPSWGEDVHLRLKSEKYAYFNADMRAVLNEIDLKGKTIAQFCCNNGRELLSLLDSGANAAFGFDIAENIISQAQETAQKAGITNCTFTACDILEIPTQYHGQFDFIMFTIGAITWFEDLIVLFEKASLCLKPGGQLLIHDSHPLINMLPVPGETEFDSQELNRLAYSYFRKEPWLENSGMGYISGKYESRTFTSFSHTLSSIINTLAINGIRIVRFDEFDYDIGITNVYDGKGFPLSYILVASK